MNHFNLKTHANMHTSTCASVRASKNTRGCANKLTKAYFWNDRWVDRQTDRQAGRQTDRQIDR